MDGTEVVESSAFNPSPFARLANARRLPISLVLCAGLLLCMSLRAESQPEFKADMTGETVLKMLKEKQDEELNRFIQFLDYKYDKSNLTDRELDPIIDALRTIQTSDPYKKSINGRGRTTELFQNRHVAGQCLFRFRFQKIAHAISQLPLAQRVDRIIDGIEHPPTDLSYETTGSFSKELVRAGKEAVPFIVQHKPAASYHRRAIITALAEIGDPRAIGYIVDVLKTKDESFQFERPIAAKLLAKFNDKVVVQALVDALQDETIQLIDRHMEPAIRAGHVPYDGRYYSVQAAAAESLTTLTGKNWGWFYNEDYGTWSAWLRSEQPDAFTPALVQRSDKEVAKLIEYLFHRRMSARPNPWQPQNVLESQSGVADLALDLRKLEKGAATLIVAEYRARTKDSPLWKSELLKWTKQLLEAIATKEALEAGQALD